MTEQDIQRNIIKWLESESYYVVKVVSASKSGVPDILCCIEGKFVAIEVKTPQAKTNVSKLQHYNLNKIDECGGYSMVAWSVDMVKEFIECEVLV